MTDDALTGDLATLAADDAVLIALGRNEPVPDGDEVTMLLAAWRTELGLDQQSSDAVATPIAEPEPPRRHGWSRQARGLMAAAAAVVLLAGGATLAAGNAGPGSPLWPITTIMYGQRADSVIAQQDAERAIEQARQALTQASYTEAAHLLDLAATRAGEVRDGGTRQRLLDEVAAVRGLLPASAVPLPIPAPTSLPTPLAPSPAPGQPHPTSTSAPASGGPVLPLPLPLPTLPSLPPLPLPTLPIPLPTLSLLTLLP